MNDVTKVTPPERTVRTDNIRTDDESSISLTSTVVLPGDSHGLDHYLISATQIETIEGCADRITESDTFNASWVSGCVAASVAFLTSFIVLLFQRTNTRPDSVALVLLGVLAVLCEVMAFVVFKIEERARRSRKSHVQALKATLAIYRKHMIPGEPRGVTPPPSGTSGNGRQSDQPATPSAPNR
jgi:hypothetical protein